MAESKPVNFGYAYLAASGPSFDNCCFIGRRFDADLGWDETYGKESWVCSIKRNPKPTGENDIYSLSRHKGTVDRLTGLFRGDSGTVYACTLGGYIWINSHLDIKFGEGKWKTLDMQGVSLTGMFGLDEKNIFTWGPITQFNRLYRYDGRYWLDGPEPSFEITAMHAAGPELAYAVGSKGEIARLEDKTWTQVESPAGEKLTGVFVASPDEIYACGDKGGIFEGDSKSWRKIGEGPGPLFCVAKYKDEVFVGAGPLGTARRAAGAEAFEVYKPKLHAVSFDTRDQLVVGATDRVFGTHDPALFRGTGADWLTQNLAGKPLAFWEK